MDFIISIKCIAHKHPVHVKFLVLHGMDAVDNLFSSFGAIYKGRRCPQHSHDALIPVLTGVKSGGA